MASKRRRNSAFLETQMGNSDEQIQMSGLSITELPTTILFVIVLKLSTKSIATCKCVCKSWHSLISDPHFAEAHLAQAKTCTLIREMHNLRFSRSLYLLEPEDVSSPDSGYCLCKASSAEKCEHCHFPATVKSKLKIPMAHVRAMLDIVDNNSDVMFSVANRSENNRQICKDSSGNLKYDVVNSCNGWLCLRKSVFCERDRGIGVVVCNPVLGEFMNVPVNCDTPLSHFGLGFSPNHNRYKVIRLTHQWRKLPETKSMRCFIAAAEIHTLGTDSWRSVDISAFELSLFVRNPVYLDGALYWVFIYNCSNFRVASFDLDEERFQIHSAPPLPLNRTLTIGVLGGHVYVYTFHVWTHVDIWVMDGHGISKSWTKLFTIDVSELHGSRTLCTYQLIYCLNNEAVVLFRETQGEFIYYNQSEGLRCKHLKFEGDKSYFHAISHTPSFISLKDIVKHGDVEILNINSRCGKLKLVEETYPLLLQGGRKLALDL